VRDTLNPHPEVRALASLEGLVDLVLRYAISSEVRPSFFALLPS
jgi:hypothetical protein